MYSQAIFGNKNIFARSLNYYNLHSGYQIDSRANDR